MLIESNTYIEYTIMYREIINAMDRQNKQGQYSSLSSSYDCSRLLINNRRNSPSTTASTVVLVIETVVNNLFYFILYLFYLFFLFYNLYNSTCTAFHFFYTQRRFDSIRPLFHFFFFFFTYYTVYSK